MPRTGRPCRVVVPVLPGLPLFELAVPAEIFGTERRDLHPDWYEFSLCAVGNRSVPVQPDARLRLDAGVAALSEADTIIVPSCDEPGTPAPAPLLRALRQAGRRGARIIGLGGGTFVLAQAGLLDGRAATTHWMFAAEFARAHPRVQVRPDALYVQDDRYYTAAGTAASIDLCLRLVADDLGTAVAAQVGHRMIASPHRSGDQAQTRPEPANRATGASLAATLDWAIRRLDHDLPVAELAEHASMSLRTFNRQFRRQVGISPVRWLTRQRLWLACQLLETTDLTVERIAQRCGYTHAVPLRQHFRRECGMSPSDYRARHNEP
ncbi:helix-turn-helix domain-containing protein [Saccharopolyspora sp. NPDC050389]|uniref:GlxA family transcriptional regulator n=1 Tax=Saccharopolyspora sp. NPDC050389 TaxID=3155516 RepID=UPI0033D36E7A